MSEFEAAEPKFAPRCTICTHVRRAEIEHAIARGVSQREVAKRYKVSLFAVNRHWCNHVSGQLKTAKKIEALKPGAKLDELIVDEGRGLLENLQMIRGKLYRQLELAISLDDRQGCTAVTRELHRNLELSAKATGELQANARPNVTNIVLSQNYVALRHNILRALRPFPEAAAAVVDALRQVERNVELAPVVDAQAVAVRHG